MRHPVDIMSSQDIRDPATQAVSPPAALLICLVAVLAAAFKDIKNRGNELKDLLQRQGIAEMAASKRTALECGSSSYRLRFLLLICKAVAAATAPQGARGASIWRGKLALRIQTETLPSGAMVPQTSGTMPPFVLRT